ncbi:gluconokinase [Pseudokineococcus sp. 5B2Z-1]|uniref:gluconokinase n=1 Tax=Pseudokineococcus sp. 5B2Z-1 TaxID=3132744 RepID=UPI0030B66402
MGRDEFAVAPAAAQEPLVLALDVGSTATRGAIHDATGRPVGRRAKVAHAFTTGADGTSEVDADQVVDEVADVLTRLLDHHEGPPVAGVALDTFATSLVGVDASGRALGPCSTYADSRAAAHVAPLRTELDEAAVQQRTGTRLHTSYLAPRLRWLAETRPDLVARVATWTSLGEYVHLRLLGVTAASTPTAAWTGMLDRRTGRWDEELLAASGTTAQHLSPVQDPGVPIDGVDAARVARRWPALAHAAWFPAVADGLSSNLGTGAGDAASMALAAATSGAVRVLVPGVPEHVPEGLWCYRVDARRSLLGGAVNDVGRLVAWAQATLRLPEDDAALDAVLAAAPDPRTPAVVPFLSGERSTGWAASARAVVADVSAGTTPEALFRGSAEGVATTYARVVEQLVEVAGRPERLVASGRITQGLPHLLQLVADAIGAPVQRVDLKRTTLRGTALLALEALAPDVVRADPPVAGVFEPRSERAGHYAAVRERFDALYDVARGR